jgi:hypothetical protein
MKFYINYSDKAFEAQQNFALKMAKLRGGFDNIMGYSREDIDQEFYEQNGHILDQPRGGGYWLWKPYLINKKLSEVNDGDYLFYSDSGAFFLKNVDMLIEELEKYDQDIMGFELPLIESQWTKKELFINMDCTDEMYSETNQVSASYILIRKTKFSVDFFDQYLKYGCDEINITDSYNNIAQDQSFIEHRHDQSIFSLLYKRNSLRAFKDPSQLGKYPGRYGGSLKNDFEINKLYTLNNGRFFRQLSYKENYSMILFHNRRDRPLAGYLKFYIKMFLCNFGLLKEVNA